MISKMIVNTETLGSCILKHDVQALDYNNCRIADMLYNAILKCKTDVENPRVTSRMPDMFIRNLLTNKLGDFSESIILSAVNKQEVGILIAMPVGDIYNIFLVGVDKESQGKRIAESLLFTLSGLLSQKKVKYITIDVHCDNLAAVRFYERCGFTLSYGDILEGIEYKERLGAYGLLVNGNKVGVVKVRGNYFLPGGGINEFETHTECLEREFLEETGYEIEVLTPIKNLTQFILSRNGKTYYKLVGFFYEVRLGGYVTSKTEIDHEFIWLDIDEANNRLFMDYQQAAVSFLIKNSI